jgi:HAD superfamily hydrolase (TIGR01509 family)
MMNADKIEAALFDIDEVVVASTKLQVEAEQVAAREMSALYRPAGEFEALRNEEADSIDWTRFRGMARVGIASVIWGVEETDELADEYRRAVVETTVRIADNNNIIFVNGAEKGLAQLVAEGVTMAAVTSSHRDIFTAYDNILGLDRFFEASVTYGEAEHNKPKPHPYLLGMVKLGVSPGKTIVVEDSKSGITAGLDSGASIIGVPTTMSEEDLYSAGVHTVAENWSALVNQIMERT